MKYSVSSRNINPWSRTKPKRRSRLYDQIMTENSPQKNSRNSTESLGIIKREFSTPYNPQQNGVAEQKNQTIMEATKAMLHDQDLSMHLWEEATWTTVYV